ncbi:hypothetical protein ACFE04_024170 [Oxalis oulophora]
MSSPINNDDSTKIIKLKTQDNQTFEVEESILTNQLKLLKIMAEDDCTRDVIPVPNVDGKTFAMITEWCRKHDNPCVTEEEQNELKKWDDSFLDVDQSTLLNLLLATNYLDCEKLFNQLCDKAASMIRGKQPEEIRETFNITNDFTPEEEAEIRNQNPWAFQ